MILDLYRLLTSSANVLQEEQYRLFVSKEKLTHCCKCCHFLPGHATGITHPAQLLLVVAAAGLADVELAVQTLTLGVDQELEGLQTSNTVRLSQAALVSQQLSLGVFFFNLCLQVTEKDKVGNRRVYYRRQEILPIVTCIKRKRGLLTTSSQK